LGSLMEKYYLEDLSVSAKTILKWMLKKVDGMV
jgi:hypothetical protein